MFILDTDQFSLLEWREGAARQNLLKRLSRIPPEQVFTTIITYEEQTRGWMAYAARARTTAHQVEAYGKLKHHLHIYSRVRVLDFDERAGAEFDRLKAMRIKIGSMDMKIASIALANGATLLTKNSKDFIRIPSLRIEDWSI